MVAGIFGLGVLRTSELWAVILVRVLFLLVPLLVYFSFLCGIGFMSATRYSTKEQQ